MGINASTDPNELRRHVSWLEGVLLAMDEVVVVFDPAGQIVFLNPSAKKLFGEVRDPAAWPPNSGFFLDPHTRCAPSSLPMRQALDGAPVRQMELFFRPPAKPEAGHWQSFSASPVRGENDAILGAVLVGRDTTATRDAVAELLNQGLQVQLLQQISAAANAAKDLDSLMRETLAAICTTTGWPLAHFYQRRGVSLSPSEVWHGDSEGAYRPVVGSAMSTVVPADLGLLGQVMIDPRAKVVSELDRDAALPHGRALVQAGLTTAVLVPISIGQEICGVMTFFLTDQMAAPGLYFLDVLEHAAGMIGRVFERDRDRAALEAYAKQVRTLSLIDELTGLNNRRGFLTLAKQQLRVGERTKAVHYLIFADIDGMKEINDQLGHAQGDEALRDVAVLLKKTLRTSDIIARLGGDEFVALAVHTVGEASEPVKERFYQNLATHNASGVRPYKLEVSLGATRYDPTHPTTLEELISQADERMYLEKEARRAGRTNRRSPK